MPKDLDVVTGEPIEAAWGNQTVRDKLVQRATNSADLASGWPAPQDGETVWQQDSDQLWIWDGTAWVEYAPKPYVDERVLRAGDTMTGTLQAAAAGNALVPITISSSEWSPYFTPAACWKEPGGTVHVQGMIQNDIDPDIPDAQFMTLPVGYRPATTQVVTVLDGAVGTPCRINIGANGSMYFDSAIPRDWFDLVGTSFWAGW